MPNITLYETQDGSWTCFHHGLGEHYHNKHGAYEEAESMYIANSSWEERLTEKSHLTLLDPFFGLGFNTFGAMMRFAQLKQTKFPEATLTIHAIELDPEIFGFIPEAIDRSHRNDLKQLYSHFAHKIYYQTLEESLKLAENPLIGASLGIQCHIHIGDTRAIIGDFGDNAMDLIYHDPFSLLKQPELWTQQLIDQYYRILNKKTGTLLTYGGAASTRSAMINAGFHVYSLPVPDFKTGTVGTMHPDSHQVPLTALETDLMTSRSGLPYYDSPVMDWDSKKVLNHREELLQSSERPTSSEIHRRHRQS